MCVDQPELASKIEICETRPEEDGDYARLLSTVMAATFDVELLRNRRERWSQKYWFERVALLDGKVVGIIELVESGGKGCSMVRIVVEPSLRGRGIGTALLGSILDNENFVNQKVFVEVRDNDEKSLDFAKKHGCAFRNHVFESTLDPSTFDVSRFQSYVDRTLESGLRIATIAELGDSEENRYRLWEIEDITDADIPGVDLDMLTTWEDAKKSWFTASWYNPASYFVALDGEKWVACSAVSELSPGHFYVQMTCTLREYRGRGIATALKALATDYARKVGGKVIKTNNNEKNETMLAINRKFGFQPEPGWLELTKPASTAGDMN